MDFEEALGRFVQTDPREMEEAPDPDGRIRLVAPDDTGDRFLIYGTDKGVSVSLRYEGDTFWATQQQMAAMFGVQVPAISKHLKNIFDEGELVGDSVVSEMEITASDGKRYLTALYNLNAVISVGYRVSSKEGTAFRIWATDKLFQILTKGFFIDAPRLKQPEAFDRVKELRRIVQDIRASEINIYREVRDLCTLVRDYASGSREWQGFYARMQNKLFWAVVQATATQLRLERSNADKPNMGLTFWSGSRLLQKDALIAKNYLAHGEAEEMNRLSVMLLDFFEDQLKIGVIITMADLEAALEKFIRNMNRTLLPTRLRIPTKTEADTHCKAEYKRFSELRAMGEPEADTRYLDG